jgi:hypothetical protein
MRRWCVFMGLFVWGVCGAWAHAETSAVSSPSNDGVEKQVEEITADEGFRWLKEGGTKRNAPDDYPTGKFASQSGTRGNGRIPSPEEGGGCAFEPDFRDFERPEPSDNSGCGGGQSPACDCAPDIGSCSADPFIGTCGACVPSPRMMVPLGYAVAGIALALIIFFIVRALIKRLPETDTPIEFETEDMDDASIRVSRIHRVEPSSLLDRATTAARDGDYKRAVGYLYLLSLSILSRRGLVELDKSTTNWHILRQNVKNGGPDAALRVIVRHFEDLFFGNRPATIDRYNACHEQVRSTLLPLQTEEPHEQG